MLRPVLNSVPQCPHITLGGPKFGRFDPDADHSIFLHCGQVRVIKAGIFLPPGSRLISCLSLDLFVDLRCTPNELRIDAGGDKMRGATKRRRLSSFSVAICSRLYMIYGDWLGKER